MRTNLASVMATSWRFRSSILMPASAAWSSWFGGGDEIVGPRRPKIVGLHGPLPEGKKCQESKHSIGQGSASLPPGEAEKLRHLSRRIDQSVLCKIDKTLTVVLGPKCPRHHRHCCPLRSWLQQRRDSTCACLFGGLVASWSWRVAAARPRKVGSTSRRLWR